MIAAAVLAISLMSHSSLPVVKTATTKSAEPTAQSLDSSKKRPAVSSRRHRSRRIAARVNSSRRRSRSARFRRIVFPFTPLKGSHESMLRQNERTFGDDLERIQDDDQLELLTANKELVDVPETDSLRIAANLPVERRYCRPWTRTFLDDMSREYYEQFGQPLQVNSAVRTVQVQKKLRRRNRNAAMIDGDVASPHLTGAAVDIARRGMNKAQIKWMRDYLMNLRDAGQIDVAEEFRTRCFHITVYKEYELSRLEQPGSLAAPVKVIETSSEVPPGPTAEPIRVLENEDLQQQTH
jgi:Family of unknown function (DUF5715)